MTIIEVRKRIAAIANNQGDPERAHIQEDELWRDVLIAIGEGDKNAVQLANEALRSAELKFDRWYA